MYTKRAAFKRVAFNAVDQALDLAARGLGLSRRAWCMTADRNSRCGTHMRPNAFTHYLSGAAFAGEQTAFSEIKLRLGPQGFAAWMAAVKWRARFEHERENPPAPSPRTARVHTYEEERALLARMRNVEMRQPHPAPTRVQSSLVGSKVEWREEFDDEYQDTVECAIADTPSPWALWWERAQNCVPPERWHIDEWEESLSLHRAFENRPNLLWLVWQVCAEGKKVAHLADELGCHRNTIHNYVNEGLARLSAARRRRERATRAG